jgi:hypothetical protein
MSNFALLHIKTADAAPAPLPPRAEGREKFLSAKIPCNPLKRLDSDERIQGNPSFSNPHKLGFSRSNGQRPRKPKTARSDRRSILSMPGERLGSLHLAAPPGDQARAALVADVNPQPVERDAQPVADADQKVDVGEAPQPPGELALVAEGRRWRRAAEPGPDDLGDIDTLLLGGWRDAGNWLPIRAKDDRRVADGENLALSRDREVGFNLEPPYLVRRSVEPLRSGRGLNASGPDDRRRSQRPAAEDDAFETACPSTTSTPSRSSESLA